MRKLFLFAILFSLLFPSSAFSQPDGEPPAPPRSIRTYSFVVIDYNTTEIPADRMTYIACHDRFDQVLKSRISNVRYQELGLSYQKVLRLTFDATNGIKIIDYRVNGFVNIVPNVRQIGWDCYAKYYPARLNISPARVEITRFATTLDPTR